MLHPRDNRSGWEQRIERAKTLTAAYPFASEVLTFYAVVAGFQRALFEELKSTSGNGSVLNNRAFHDSLEVGPLLPRFPRLLRLVERAGTPVLAEAAEELEEEGREYWGDLLSEFWRAETHVVDAAPETHLFFVRAVLQPYAELLASRSEAELPRFGESVCPICTGKPQVGVLREEGHGAKRSLVCSLCLTEWDYRRIICPACGEQRFEKLASYTASAFEHMRVDACESCKTYVNTVDLTKDGLAIPEVDELASLPLSLWAQEKGYTKLQCNLLGL